MSNTYRYQSPDTRLGHIAFAKQQEDERKKRLDERDNQRLNAIKEQFQVEQQHGADLDRRESRTDEMQVERAHTADLDRRDATNEGLRFERARTAEMDRRDKKLREARTPFDKEFGPGLPVPGDPSLEPRGRVLPAEAAPYLRKMIPRWQRETTYRGPGGQGYQPLLPVAGDPEYEPGGGLTAPSRGGLPPQVGVQQQEAGIRSREAEPFVQGESAYLALAAELGEIAGFTPEWMKKHVWEPLVPDFAQKIPGEVLETLLPTGVRQVASVVGDLGGPTVPDVTVTDELVEEAATWILDPLNLMPGIGFGPDLMRAAKAGVPALRTLLTNPKALQAYRTARRGAGAVWRGEAGGTHVGGVADSLESMKGKISNYLRQSGKVRPGLEAERSIETGQRAAALEAEKARLLKQGVPYEEAIQRATTKLKGVKPTRTLAESLSFTDEEAAAFAQVIEREAKTYEKVRLLADVPAGEGKRAAPSIFTKMRTNQTVTPAEGTLLRRLFGDDIADAALAAGRNVDELTKALEETYGVGVRQVGRTVPGMETPPGFRPGIPREQPRQYGVDLEAPLAKQAAKDKAVMLKDLEKSFPVTPSRQPFTRIEEVLPGAQLGTEYAARVSKEVVKESKVPSLATKILDEILEIPRFFTGLYSLLDASVGGRQLRMLATAFAGPRWKPQLPRAWARSYWDSVRLMFKSSASRTAYRQSLKDDPTIIRLWHPDGVEDIPFGKLWERTGGRLKPDEIDERVVSNILRKTPGFKQTAEGFELGLEAGHHAALKDELLGIAATGQKLTMKDVQALADATTALTGRGNLGKNLLADIVTALGWAPRLRVAFWQSLFRLGHRNPKVRSLAQRRIAGYMGTGMSMMGVAEVAGADVTWNPTNTDFGKIKIACIRFNVWGPDVVAMRYLAQGIFGMATSPLTGDYKVDWQDSLLRYARSGANPAVGLFVDWRTGKTFTGERFNIKEWQERLPLAFQDIVDAFELKGGGIEGVIAGAAVAPFVMVGIGVGAYEKAEDKLAMAYNELVDMGKFGDDALYYADGKEGEALVVSANIDKFPALVKLDDERKILSRMENNDIKAKAEEDYNLPDLAKRFNEGEEALAPEIMKKWREYRHDVHVAMDARTWGVDFGADSEAEKLLTAWMSINPNDPKYADPLTGKPDYDLIDADSEKAEVALIEANPRLAAAVGETLSSIDPELGKMEPALEEALGLKSDSYDIPRWTSEIKNQEQIAKVRELAAAKNREFATRGRPNVSMVTIYREVEMENPKIPDSVMAEAYRLRPGSGPSKHYRNPKRDEFLLSNEKVLGVYFPDMYSEELLAEIYRGGTTGTALAPTQPQPVGAGVQATGPAPWGQR